MKMESPSPSMCRERNHMAVEVGEAEAYWFLIGLLMSAILHLYDSVLVVFLEDESQAASFFLNLLKSWDLLSGRFLALLCQWVLLDIESVVKSFPQECWHSIWGAMVPKTMPPTWGTTESPQQHWHWLDTICLSWVWAMITLTVNNCGQSQPTWNHLSNGKANNLLECRQGVYFCFCFLSLGWPCSSCPRLHAGIPGVYHHCSWLDTRFWPISY